jgi:hypothetical protein
MASDRMNMWLRAAAEIQHLQMVNHLAIEVTRNRLPHADRGKPDPPQVRLHQDSL